MVENRRFNRVESRNRHRYLTEFPPTQVGGVQYRGRLKCRLAHGQGYTIITPDQLYLMGPPLRWIQPLFFGPPLIAQLPDRQVTCTLWVDVSFGQRLEVSFTSKDLVQKLADCSDLYNCVIQGPRNLTEHATGRAFNPDNPLLNLFHHTTATNKNLILAGREYRKSRWNIAGTKRIENYGYVYFTSLDRIATDDDLVEIAMSSEGELSFLVDGGDVTRASDALTLPVYRETSSARQATLEHQAAAALLAPQHLHRHSPPQGAVYYAVVNPFTHRVGLQAGATLAFASDGTVNEPAGLKRPDYLVVGDATHRIGLAAPYDEDTTRQLLKLHGCGTSPSILEEWITIANTDQFSRLTPELHRYLSTGP